MEIAILWLKAMVAGVPALFTNPLTYLLLIIIALQWKRQVDIERKLFSSRLHTVAEGLFQSIFFGCLGGFLASCIFIGLGVVFALEPFFYLWAIALILMLFQIRYLCFAYSGAVLGLLVLLSQWFPQIGQLAWLESLWTSLQAIYLPSLFIMVACLHLIEALLVYVTGGQRATPVFIQSKRGRLVGGFHLQQFWFVPLFMLIQGGTSSLPPLFSGWPLFTPELGAPFALLLLPAVLGYSEQAVSFSPQEKAKQSAKGLLIYSLSLLGLTLLAVYLSPLLFIVVILFSFLGHEAMFWISSWQEKRGVPIYIHPKEGLKILAVIPYSPAAKMGLQAGEVILKANGQRVNQRNELYQALSTNQTFCKLEVINLEGNLKFAQSSLYAEDHHQLGVILAPDQQAPYYLEAKRVNLIHLLLQKIDRQKNQNTIEG